MSVPCYTLRDVYNAARDERKFDYCFWLQITGIIIGEYVFMLLGRLLVIVASFLILSIGASGFLIALPVVAKPSTLWFNFNIFWGFFLLFSICFNYISAVITDPGRPAIDNDYKLNPFDITNNAYMGKSCKKCALPKPARTHHCSICKRCVLKMDHHCPWVNNCIGLNNYRYFYSFLLWTCLGTAYLAFLLGPTVLKEGSILRLGEVQYDVNRRIALRKSDANLRGSTKLKKMSPRHFSNGEDVNPTRKLLGVDEADFVIEKAPLQKSPTGMFHSIHMYYQLAATEIQAHRDSEVSLSLLFVLSGAISFAVGILLTLHTYLGLSITDMSITKITSEIFPYFASSSVLSAQTTIELFLSMPERSKMKKAGRIYLNPYDRGWKSNIKQVFGHTLPLLLSVCLPSCRLPPLDLGSKGHNSASSRGAASIHTDSEC